MVKQTISPVLWLILDDGSQDNTKQIVDEAICRGFPIHFIQFPYGRRDIGLHLSELIKYAFDYVIDFCYKNEIPFELIANIDGDMILETDYFEQIIPIFKSNPNLGIASGGLYHIKKNILVQEKITESEPSGGMIVIKLQCLKECGGIVVSKVWESAFIAKAKVKGWEARRIEKAIAIETRDTDSAEGLWKGYLQKGRGARYLGLPFVYALAKGSLFILKSPHYICFAYICGYIDQLIKGKQIYDRDVRYYYNNIKPKEIKKLYLSKLKMEKK